MSYALTKYLNLYLIYFSDCILGITLFFTTIDYNSGECPKPELLKPCICDEDVISCGGRETIPLKTIFHGLSPKLENSKKHFKQFYLNNTEINELPENTFEDITFEEIRIENALNLSSIHTKAFTANNLLLKTLTVSNTSLKNSPPDHNIFSAISQMVNIQTVVIKYSLIDEIPDNAFQSLNGTDIKFKFIDLSFNFIAKLGNNAFKNLPWLSDLQLENNEFDHISENAFNIGKPDSGIFHLSLHDCKLNSSSFEKGAFNNFNRSTFLHFDIMGGKSNNITYLDRHIFEEFLKKDKRNQIELNTIDCNDCRSFWLVEYGENNTQINSMECSTSKLISDKSNFPDCVKF